MATANPPQLFLLADHIKLSLLERQRAATLNIDSSAQDGQVSRSLDSFGSSLQTLELQLSQEPDPSLQDQYDRLKSQYNELQAQFSVPDPSSTTVPTITTPNDPSLGPDFAAATDTATTTSSTGRAASKSVRFTDNPSSGAAPIDPSAAGLFPYRDDPSDAPPPDHTDLSNQQIHAYHSQVLREQDEQLDALGASIGRQRDLSIQIGNELDEHAIMLDEVDGRVDRHQGQLDRARGRLGKVARGARDNWSLTTIVVLIVILVLLIVITK